MNESLAKLMRRAIPGLTRIQSQRLKRATQGAASSARKRGELRKSLQRAIAKAQLSSATPVKSAKIPSALNRFFPNGVGQ